MPTLAFNKRANFDYEIKEKYEAGLVLLGHEVKSIKTGHINLKGSYVTFKKAKGRLLPELFLINVHIPLYKFAGSIKNYDPYRSRKLLLKKNEISHLIGKKQEQGLTLVPIKVYTKRGYVKLEFGIGRGKKKADKRETIKKRDIDRRIRTLTKRR
ncbi:SsrA-binding protein [Candidatus Falkowbacteria bacterium CG_4_9_14_3_um_filter_36_9]|uniref:SsrA-binding protein n=2 Tax=Candidatus Falkowiibacteriota TaxID=1752728 RepID=A0A1J4TCC1_9BACT|nr:MAG: SsrA-binding protein [Candidatus Falkowbacteria bacterium CG1_02_37_44]PIV51367.1 MAG: SsrA-binding protein [Candidatus Falkowbacteria bacterium CG02_land_8_20_14_3_00_36_14]PIX11610.1 MAG: SsrA-binding protein [Candidatus Falkowbacteria bacterium CG_4_8_14_3_um_filter_36_11]PJA10297.1 MAG: SsrA-binding protein [Candidatus Falkowbacteria bacterium CG_4_10_14_0_2_um_filter_36_22]PJB18498.1 MAG: SsrA-binding protein [Candidatus Falkowbacteria bacterium CG_4_9_14_3_um_filter_36_9]